MTTALPRRQEQTAELVRRLRPLIPPIAATAAETARSRLPARDPEPAPHDPMRQAIEEAITAFPAVLDHAGTPSTQVLDAFRRLGEAEARDGREPEDLQDALSSAAGVAAGRLTEQALRHGLTATPEQAGALTRIILAYIDRLRRAALEGHAACGTRHADGLSRSRRHLVQLLLSPRCDPAELKKAAARANWTMPRTVAAVAVDRPVPAALPGFLPPDILPALHLDIPCLFFPDPAGPGRRAVLERILDGHPAVVGPTAEVARTALSLRLARRGLERLPDPILSAHTPVHVTEHIPAMLLAHSPELTRQLTERRLAPLQRLRPAQRARLAETLLAYFECGFNATETAARLHTHPQTVRNHVRLLSRLFGPELYQPEHALDYLMALYAWRLQAGESHRRGRAAEGPRPRTASRAARTAADGR